MLMRARRLLLRSRALGSQALLLLLLSVGRFCCVREAAKVSLWYNALRMCSPAN